MLVRIRSLIFSLGFGITVVVYGVISLCILPLPPMLRHRIVLTWCNFIIVWLRLTCGVRYKIIGIENIKKTTAPFVVLSKHQSPWETFILQIIFFPVTTLLKKELLNIPFFGWGLRCFRPIGIDRSNPREALKQVKEGGLASLENGLNVLLFPEGTRVKVGERGKYARSGPEIAIKAGVDILPIAQNSGNCWPIKTFLRYPGLITLVIGQPISTKGKTSKQVVDKVEHWIETEMENLNGSNNIGEESHD